MTENVTKKDKKATGCGKKKLIAAAAAVLSLIALITAFLLLKNPLFCYVSEKLASDGRYYAAEKYAGMCSGEKADVIEEYVNLRQDINANYALMVAGFDREKVEDWRIRAESIRNNSQYLSDGISLEAIALSERLDEICNLLNEYDALRPEAMELFDVFNEINRLYAKDESGENPVFTISAEIAAVDRWETTARKLDAFSAKISDAGKMYLFTYFVKEAQGEAVDLRSAMYGFLAQGYDAYAQIRVTGETVRTFPSIQNGSGETVNLQNKEKYETFMYRDMCGALAEMLGEFYDS
ncbi:MAG: hypothetical protein IJO36_04295 [Clostridia bacterium]|nr:hypothetical protein [Clostridia bacterium]